MFIGTPVGISKVSIVWVVFNFKWTNNALREFPCATTSIFLLYCNKGKIFWLKRIPTLRVTSFKFSPLGGLSK